METTMLELFNEDLVVNSIECFAELKETFQKKSYSYQFLSVLCLLIKKWRDLYYVQIWNQIV